jgi:hypothetical protein
MVGTRLLSRRGIYFSREGCGSKPGASTVGQPGAATACPFAQKCPRTACLLFVISHCKSPKPRAVNLCPIGKTTHKASRAGSFRTYIIEGQGREPKTSGKWQNDPGFGPLVNPFLPEKSTFLVVLTLISRSRFLVGVDDFPAG